MRAGGHRLRAGIAAAGRRSAPVGPPAVRWASGGPRLAVCANGASTSRGAVVVPRTGARRSSLGALSRGRWASRASFGGWGRCGRLFSAPPMCQAGWSRGSWGCGRGLLLSGGRFKTPRPFGPPPASGGLAPPQGRRRISGKSGFFAHFFAKMHAFRAFSGKIGHAAHAKGTALDARQAAPSGARRFTCAPVGAGLAAGFPECAPQGGHTPQNLTLFACELPAGPRAARMPRRRLGGRTVAQSPRPFPSGKGGEGSRIPRGGESPAGGQRCGAGYGLRAGERSESACCSVRGRP